MANAVTSISISAAANDTKATVSGTGTKTLNAGDNTFSIVVTAENGVTKTYIVRVTRAAAGPSFNPVMNSYTACPTSVISCGGHSFLAGNIQAAVISSNSTSFTVRIKKCNGTNFTNSGTAYVNIGTTCTTAVASMTYGVNASYVDITAPLRSGTTTYWITVASATTDYYHAGNITVTN